MRAGMGNKKGKCALPRNNPVAEKGSEKTV
jgi:hypothetical protein